MKIFTKSLIILIVLSYKLTLAQFSGTIEVPSPGIPDLVKLIDSLKIVGVSGPIVVNIADGNYPGRLDLSSIPGWNFSKSAIFQSKSGDSTAVVISDSATGLGDNYVFSIQEENVSLKNLTVKSLNPSYCKTVEIYANGEEYDVLNCVILAPLVSSLIDNVQQTCLLVGPNRYIQGLNVSNCVINGGGIGMYVDGSGIGASENVIINNNILKESFGIGMYVGRCDGPIVSDNTIYGNISSSFIGLKHELISKVSAFSGGKFLRNRIICHKGKAGIVIANSGTAGFSNITANNFVYMGDNLVAASGILLEGFMQNQNIYYNSVNITSTNVNSNAFEAVFPFTNVEVQNNLFANTGGGLCDSFASTFLPTIMDYNNLYTTGSNVGMITTTSYANLAAWQTGTTKEANSIRTSPMFASSTNLHTCNDTLRAGTPLAVVGDDIDGTDFRPFVTPVIGADEFPASFIPTYTISNLCIGSVAVIKGSFPGAVYNWSNGDSTQRISFVATSPDTLIVQASNACQSFSDTLDVTPNPLPIVDFGADSGCVGALLDGGSYVSFDWSTGASSQTLKPAVPGTYFVTSTDVNGCKNSDTIKLNASPLLYLAHERWLCQGGGDEITLDIESPGKDVLWSTSDTTQTILVNMPGLYTVTVSSANGCATIDSSNVRIDSFCTIIGISNNIDRIENLKIYPNPSNGFFDVVIPLELLDQNAFISIHNLLGEEVFKTRIKNNTPINIALPDLNSGMYVLQVLGKQFSLKKNIIINK